MGNRIVPCVGRVSSIKESTVVRRLAPDELDPGSAGASRSPEKRGAAPRSLQKRQFLACKGEASARPSVETA